MTSRRILQAAAVAAAATLAASACSSNGTDKNAGDQGSGDRGPITLATGKDTSGNLQNLLDEWNSAHPREKATITELPTSADAQRQQMVQNAQVKSDAYSVLGLDVTWTAEFAANRWIDQLPAEDFPLDGLLPSAVDTAKYRGKVYAAPYQSNGGMLFYRTDLLKKVKVEAPTTWAEMAAVCKKVLQLPEASKMSCYAGQFDKYEGLTVNFSEAVQSAGGELFDDNGKPTVDTPEAKAGLKWLVDSFKDGTIPKEALTYQEENGREAFQAGKLVFLRQWPYVWNLANETDGSSKVAGKFDVAPLPGMNGPGSSTLGGLNLAVSTFAPHKASARDFITFLTGEGAQRSNLLKAAVAPTRANLYGQADLQKKFPYLATLGESIESARPRPKAVRYGDVTAAIQNAIYPVVSGKASPDTALADLQQQLEKITAE
ncbi:MULTISPECIES: ABC transporter substrate-binding protein [unclassified Streptomyces]|uniref:ABC transporter substrate-binding protein n=1 Tax=unclassified Streptomyces TaxID=2593676 RepID=UPI00037AE959|nr:MULTISPECIES: ABC transporter substrate-binding protein [unclassified Streptomyces]MYX33937.1 extracellular solute-binding protein [Streptomyces sp. SID8377]